MKWSLSALGTFEKCPAKYGYKYVQKLPEDRNFAASRGVDMHKAVEDFITSKVAELPPNINFYTQFLNHLKTQEIYAEHKIALKRDWTVSGWESDDTWFRGVLDLKLLLRPSPEQEPTEGVVYDWKSGKIYPDHVDQKALYSVATFSEHPSLQRVRAIHVYLDLGKNTEVTYDRQQMHDMRTHWEARVDQLGRAIELGSFMPNPGFHCRYCSFSRFKGGKCRF